MVSGKPISLKNAFDHAHAGTKPLSPAFEKAVGPQTYEQTIKNQFDHAQDEIKIANDVLTRDQVSHIVSNTHLEQSVHSETSKKRKQAVDDAMLLMTLDDIRRQIVDFESDLEARYGENFAEDLLADLNEKGLIDDEAYQAALSIQDQDERRQAIAKLIQDAIDEGRISKADLADHEWAEDWLTLREQEQLKMKQQGLDIANGIQAPEHAPTDANDEANIMVGSDQSKEQILDKTDEATAAAKSYQTSSINASPNSLSF